MDAVEREELGNGVVMELHYDPEPSNPREWYDHTTTMWCAHSRYTLGDEQVTDPDSALQQLASEPGVNIMCGKCGEPIECDYYGSWLATDMDDDDDESALMECSKSDSEFKVHVPELSGVEIMPLYLYDHSGITMSVGQFSCPWDSGQVGIITFTHEQIKKNWLVDEITDELIEKARKLMVSEVEEYDQYLTGQVFGYIITKDDEEVDSCWGFYGYDYAMEAAKSAAENYVST